MQVRYKAVRITTIKTPQSLPAMTALPFAPHDIRKIVQNCAEQVILPFYQNLKRHEISTKSGPDDLVTHADERGEDYLRASLSAITPDACFIGEEGVASGRDHIQQLENERGAFWIADPIDGTYNFAHGRRDFAVMLAYVENGQTLFGGIYDPLRDQMTNAVRGQGAYCENVRLGGNTAQPELSEAAGYVAIQLMPGQLREGYADMATQAGNVRSLRCCGHEYLAIAHGYSNFAIYNKCMPWDHLAGTLIIRECGGIAAKWDGTAFTPADTNQSLLIASDDQLWDEIHEKWLKSCGYHTRSP